jgi:hypothetical protein
MSDAQLPGLSSVIFVISTPFLTLGAKALLGAHSPPSVGMDPVAMTLAGPYVPDAVTKGPDAVSLPGAASK